MSDAYHQALQTIIGEFKSISPEITSTFIFNRAGETIATTDATTADQAKVLVASFKSINQQAHSIGDIENLTIQGVNSQLNVTAMNSLYLSSVSTRAADQKIVKTLTHVFVPTVVQLVDQIASNPTDVQSAQREVLDPQNASVEDVATAVEEPPIDEPSREPEMPVQLLSKPFLPQPPVNQFMVEKIGGFMVSADTVRIDGDVVAKWSDLYDGKEIAKVSIETLEGRTTTCKFKPIKEDKGNSKGIIQIPEKILQSLQTGKGKLVMVKPVIEEEA